MVSIKGFKLNNLQKKFTNLRENTKSGLENLSFNLKDKIKNTREKNFFYIEHSKYATYADPLYLNTFKEELTSYTNALIRLSDKNMSSEKNPVSETHANGRLQHSLDVAENAKIAASALHLNEELAYIDGLVHDIGHLAFAHDGEYAFSKYLEYHGICELHHNSLSALILALSDIHNRTINRINTIKKAKGKPPLDKKQLEEYYSTYLNFIDAAVCHNR